MLDAGRPARFSCWKIPELGLRRGLGFRGLRAYRAYRVYKVERVGCRGLRVQKPEGYVDGHGTMKPQDSGCLLASICFHHTPSDFGTFP